MGVLRYRFGRTFPLPFPHFGGEGGRLDVWRGEFGWCEQVELAPAGMDGFADGSAEHAIFTGLSLASRAGYGVADAIRPALQVAPGLERRRLGRLVGRVDVHDRLRLLLRVRKPRPRMALILSASGMSFIARNSLSRLPTFGVGFGVSGAPNFDQSMSGAPRCALTFLMYLRVDLYNAEHPND